METALPGNADRKILNEIAESERMFGQVDLPLIHPQSLKLKHIQDDRKTEEIVQSLRNQLFQGKLPAFVQHAFEMLGQSVLHKSVLFEIYRDLDIVYQYLGRHAQAYCFYAAAKKLQGSRIWAPLLEKTILQSLERQFSPPPSETDEAPKTLRSYFCVPHKSKVDGGLIDIVRDFKNMHPASAPNNELFYKMAFEREFTELIFTLRVADRAHFWEMKEAVHQLLLQKGYLPIKDYRGH